jgi:outer membrane biosynthesis protein TonB
VSAVEVGPLFAGFVLLLCLMSSSSPQLFAQSVPAKPHRKVIVMFDPEYPTIMKNGHFDGQVRLEATVAANGTVSKVEIKGGNPILAQCASQAVSRWKYVSAPAQTIEDVIFNFNANSR